MGQYPGNELPFRDIRSVVLICLGALAGQRAIRRHDMQADGPKPDNAMESVAQRRLLIFYAVSFVVWLYLLGIQRYIIPLELLAGPILVLILVPLVSARSIAVISTSIAVLSLITLRIPDWDHIGWGQSWYAVPAAKTSRVSISSAIGRLPISCQDFHRIRAFSVSKISGYGRPAPAPLSSKRIEEPLRSARGGIKLIFAPPIPTLAREVVGSYSLDIGRTCRPFPDRVRSLKLECDIERTAQPSIPAVPLDPGEKLSFALGQRVSRRCSIDGPFRKIGASGARGVMQRFCSG